MRKLFVLCTNDYPYKVLSFHTTATQAKQCVERLNAQDAERVRKNVGGYRRIYYHVHELEVVESTLIQPWATSRG